MTLLPKSTPAKLAVLVTLAAKRRRAAKVRRVVAAALEGLLLLVALTGLIVLSRSGALLRSLSYPSQVIVWFSWCYAAFAWSALRVLPIFRGDIR